MDSTQGSNLASFLEEGKTFWDYATFNCSICIPIKYKKSWTEFLLRDLTIAIVLLCTSLIRTPSLVLTFLLGNKMCVLSIGLPSALRTVRSAFRAINYDRYVILRTPGINRNNQLWSSQT